MSLDEIEEEIKKKNKRHSHTAVELRVGRENKSGCIEKRTPKWKCNFNWTHIDWLLCNDEYFAFGVCFFFSFPFFFWLPSFHVDTQYSNSAAHLKLNTLRGLTVSGTVFDVRVYACLQYVDVNIMRLFTGWLFFRTVSLILSCSANDLWMMDLNYVEFLAGKGNELSWNVCGLMTPQAIEKWSALHYDQRWLTSVTNGKFYNRCGIINNSFVFHTIWFPLKYSRWMQKTVEWKLSYQKYRLPFQRSFNKLFCERHWIESIFSSNNNGWPIQ